MSAITHRAFSRHSGKVMIRFSESEAAKYQPAEMLEKSSGGMSFIAEHELKPGASILISIQDAANVVNGAAPHPEYLGEVRWCVKENRPDAPGYRVGVRLFAAECILCGKKLRRRSADEVDVCDDCKDRFCSTSDGKIRTCVENYLIGNVI